MAWAEPDCTIYHNGRSYTSGGAVVNDNYLIAYPSANGCLIDWHGHQIGTYKLISSRPAIFFGRRSWIGDRYYYMRATVNGRSYSIRGFGRDMIAQGKAIKV